MEAAKGFVLLIYKPLSAVKIYLDHILSVSPAVVVFNQMRIFNLDFKRDLEKMRPLHGTVFSTGFNVVDKDLSRVKTVAEAALHRK
jgi:hypothetical protein